MPHIRTLALSDLKDRIVARCPSLEANRVFTRRLRGELQDHELPALIIERVGGTIQTGGVVHGARLLTRPIRFLLKIVAVDDLEGDRDGDTIADDIAAEVEAALAEDTGPPRIGRQVPILPNCRASEIRLLEDVSSRDVETGELNHGWFHLLIEVTVQTLEGRPTAPYAV